jgi:hypothetical protein
MPLTTAGANIIADAITNQNAPTLFDANNAYIGVGTSSQVFAKSDTTLVAETPTTGRKLVTTAPSVTGGIITLTSTFGIGDANAVWGEWGIFNAASGGTMLSRKVEALGTKTSAQTWQITVDLTVTA